MISDYLESQATLSHLFALLVALFVSHLAFASPEHPRIWPGASINLVSRTSLERRRFLEICQHALPACRLNPFLLSNGHLHTFWNLVAARRNPHCAFDRILVEQQDLRYPGTFAMDFLNRDKARLIARHATMSSTPPPRTSSTCQELTELASKDRRPMLIILPGLGGGSEEEYVQETCQSLIDDSNWEIVVINSRGCSRTALTSKLFYHAGSTWDLSQAVAWLSELFPNRPLYGLGFSLGGNILTNYIASKDHRCDLKAAMIVSNPWDLEKSLDSLQSSWFGRETYLQSLGTTLKCKVLANAQQIRAHSNIDLAEVRRAKYLPDFDQAVTIPMWGFRSVRDYYRETSSAHRVASVAIPVLVLNALDDPIAAGMAIPTATLTQSPYTVLCTTKHGGHLGWHCLDGRRWIARAARAFFDEILDWKLEDTGMK